MKVKMVETTSLGWIQKRWLHRESFDCDAATLTFNLVWCYLTATLNDLPSTTTMYMPGATGLPIGVEMPWKLNA